MYVCMNLYDFVVILLSTSMSRIFKLTHQINKYMLKHTHYSNIVLIVAERSLVPRPVQLIS